jgi:hypothetical protein
MAACETCGNFYDKTFEVMIAGKKHTFDCFECAIFALAPRCQYCGIPIVGHGVEGSGITYCCAHCAHAGGTQQAVDRVDAR